MIARARGFTLVELIAIIVLLSIMGTVMLGLFGQVGRSLVTNQETQTGAQLAQACAEHIMAFRRNTAAGYGYANVAAGAATGICDASFATFPAIPGFTAPVVDIALRDSGTLPACPLATVGACKLVDIKVNKSGQQVATLILLLVNY